MRTILRLLGTSADDTDRVVAVMDSITTDQLRRMAVDAAVVVVVFIDIALLGVIFGGTQP